MKTDVQLREDVMDELEWDPRFNAAEIRVAVKNGIVMNMDGFSFPGKKIDSYKNPIASEPVQFTGFKLFYKNDLLTPGWKTLMQPKDILGLYPAPIYIQYQ